MFSSACDSLRHGFVALKTRRKPENELHTQQWLRAELPRDGFLLCQVGDSLERDEQFPFIISSRAESRAQTWNSLRGN